MVSRRRILQGASAAAAGMLAAPFVRPSHAQASARTLKYVPAADLSIIDPHGTPSYGTRDHSMMIFDTLYGVDGQNRPRPQMVEGHTVEDDGRRWVMTLRSGLRFHDGEPVRGRDVVASLNRWMKKDTFAFALADVLDELAAPDDRTVTFRLKKPFPVLPDLLGKMGSFSTGIMPERLAATDPTRQVAELVGSGPFRYVASERVAGALNVYRRFEGYVPRQEPADNMAGGKIAHFDRIEWRTIPDPATAAAALQRGEVDWWSQPTPDILTLLERPGIRTEVFDATGYTALMRFNCLQKPFDNAAIRRIVLQSVYQPDFMVGLVGERRELWSAPAGFFHPDSPMASRDGLETFVRRSDFARAKEALKSAGYANEPIIVLATADLPAVSALSEIGADLLSKIGFNVDLQTRDWATVSTRMKNKRGPREGGYHVYCNYVAGAGTYNPAAHTFLRSNGERAFDGWPSIPDIEALRAQWFDAVDPVSQAELGRKIQAVALEQVPYVPLGQFFVKSAYRSNLSGIIKSFPIFWNVRRSA